MYIGQNGEEGGAGTATLPQEPGETVWMLILSPKEKNPITNASGLCCTLKNIRAVTVILRESEECVRRKLIALGHFAEPAVFKTGDEEEMIGLGKSLSRFVCHCHFELQVLPV